MLNLAFATNASWMLRTGALKQVVRDLGRDAPTLQRYLPERVLAMRLRQPANREGTVLVLPGSSLALAELGARGRNMLWYSPRWESEARTRGKRCQWPAWAKLLHDNRIRHLILQPARLTPAQRAGLALTGAQLVADRGRSAMVAHPGRCAP